MTTMNTVTFAKAIADETRQAIMGHLCCVWCNVSEIVEKMDGKVNQPTVSHHLKKLEDAKLVLVEQVGKQRYYTLNLNSMRGCCTELMENFAPNYVNEIWWNEPVQIVPFDEGLSLTQYRSHLKKLKTGLRLHLRRVNMTLRTRS